MNNNLNNHFGAPPGPLSYIAVDLKSFYASVECVERGLDPFKTNLAVADPDRSQGTICLAITPAMKKLGVSNRCRVYEIPSSIEYIMAPPRMQLYIDYAARIYGIYLKYFSKDDIHVYSIDESFVDCTSYQELYQMSAREMGLRLTADIFKQTGITATLGVGSNLYLAKIAMDIIAKHSPDHVGELTEESFQKLLWHHRPLTDFWRIGPGTERKLRNHGILDMADIANTDEDMIYRLFGVDGELILDHSRGIETCTMKDIKEYDPKGHSMSSGQILLRDYEFEEAKLVIKEMTDKMCLDLVSQHMITDSVTMYIGYSHVFDLPGTGGTIRLMTATNSAVKMRPQIEALFERTTRRNVAIRHIGINFNSLMDESFEQYDLFSSPEEIERERKMQRAMIEVKGRYGKNAILKGMNLEKGGTMMERNEQIGGHKA